MRLVTCVLTEHDPRLVILAIAMAIAGCTVTTDLWRRSLGSSPRTRLCWSVLAGVTAAASIWATHFVAMLGYDAGAIVSFHPSITLGSALIAAAGTTLGIALASRRSMCGASALGGAVFGLAIAAMHYVGMFATRVEGVIEWYSAYIALSFAAALGFSALAAVAIKHWRNGRRRAVAPGLLVAAIVSLHFLGMAAFSVTPLSRVPTDANREAFTVMAMAIALAACVIVGAGLATHRIDKRNRSATEARLRYIADHDGLTGLPNCLRFEEALAKAFERGAAERPALLSIDLDRFKAVNEAYGYSLADRAFHRLGRRMRVAAGPGNLAARLGGDEFAVIARGGEAAVRALAERLVEVLARPIPLGDNLVTVGASIGIAFAPQHGGTPAELMQNAGVALTAAKKAGRGTYRVFDEALSDQVRQRRMIEVALRRAVARQEFDLLYQPQFDARTGRPTGAEALIRWRHPELGAVAPCTFIPLAEQLGLIGPIGRWALRRACRDALEWPGTVTLAVNLSSVQLADPRLAAQAAEILENTGFPPERLELEITETALVGDDDAALTNLRALKALGIKVSLDDFGTGYSSLTYLRRFPIDRIKIDRSFIQQVSSDAGSRSIVRALTSLGASLGLGIVAEGIESEEQRRFVVEQGCDQLQGYLLSRPITATGIASLLRHADTARAVA